MKYIIYTNYPGMNVVLFNTLQDATDFIEFCEVNGIIFTKPKLTLITKQALAC